ncbi:MAG: gliding motility-associated C-terminal domain-containing protein [Bacteroidales bacterium]|nr:gliding motility-associated C-terminal domain-containing protein [Bacteroidales bacterium]
MKNIYHIFINKVMPIRILWAVLTFVCCITWNGKVYGQQALPYSYGFENNDLSAAGWTLNNCVSGSVINTDSHHDGSYGFFFYYTTNPPQYLISPRLTGTDNGVHVEFYYKNPNAGFAESFCIGYSTSNNATNMNNYTWESEVTIPGGSNAWNLYSTDFPAGTKYVAFKLTSDDKYKFYVDDFSFTVPGTPPDDPPASCTQSIILDRNLNQEIACGTTYCFYDSGGESGSYTNSETYTATFTSTGNITLSFSEYSTESTYDKITVYDGTTSGTTLISAVSGSSLPPTVTATSGTMTVYWYSDVSNVYAGWAATITADCDACTQPSGNFSLSQNPVNITQSGSFNISNYLTNTLTPSGTLSYQTSNPGVATVDASGRVSAVSPGTTTIKITYTPSNSDYCEKELNLVVNVSDGCLVLGEGTSCSYLYGPVNNWYNYGYYQYILPMSNYSSAGEISSIAFQYCYTTAMTSKTNVNIYMGLTSVASFGSTTSWIPLSDLTLVYSGPLNCTTQGWNTFNLSQSFSYDGTSNLVIAIDDNSGAYNGQSYTFNYTSGSSGSALYCYSDGTNADPSAPPTGTLSTNYPNTKLCIDECTSRTLTFANSNVNIARCTGTTTQNPVISAGSSSGTITWSSSNESVATVSQSGVVTAHSTGTAVITARLGSSGDYCSATGSYTVTVGSSHRLTYNTTAACTGTASAAPASVTGMSATVTSTEPTCSSLPTFLGWNTASNGSGTHYSAGATVDLGCADVILYARYTDEPQEITGSGDCESAMAFCASNDNTGYDLTISATDDDSEGGIGSYLTHSPTWWFLRISQSGPIHMTIHSDCGDVDFGCWGPFSDVTCDRENDLTNGTSYSYYYDDDYATYYGTSYNGVTPTSSTTSSAINGMFALAVPSGNLVDYGGSISHDEYLQITNAQEGQIYVVVVANYSRCEGIITMNQTNINDPGAGRSDCTIVNDCNITSITTPYISECSGGTFSVSGNINFTDPPVDGTLTITDGNVSQVFTPPFVSPISYSLTGIPGNNQQHTITATFMSSTTNCERITYINAPQCQIDCPDATVAMTGYSEVIGDRYYFDACLGHGVNMGGTQTGYTNPSWRWSINPHGGVPPYVVNTQNASYTPGDVQGYDVSLTVSEGQCSSVAYGRIRVSGGLTTNLTEYALGQICVGDSRQITIGGNGSDIEVNSEPHTIETSLGHSETTFIPDGINCTTQCYTSDVTFYDFDDGAVVTNTDAIKYIRLNTEHSFIGDVQIKISCPEHNGVRRSAIILPDYFSSDNTSGVYSDNAIDPYTYVWPDRTTTTRWHIGSSSTSWYTGMYMLGIEELYEDQNDTYTQDGRTYYLASFGSASDAYDFIDDFLSRYYSGYDFDVWNISSGGTYLYSVIGYVVTDSYGDDHLYIVWLTRDTATEANAYTFSSQEAAEYFLDYVYGGNGVVSSYQETSSYRRIFFGEPDFYDVNEASSLSSAQICDGSDPHNLPGVGYDYAWTSSSQYNTVGYVYDLANMANPSDTYNNGSDVSRTLYHVLPSNVDAGTQMYQPFQSFSNLIGCPLNGTWSISVCDSWGLDNGYVFEWEIALSEDLLPSNWDYTVDFESVSTDCGNIATESGNNLIIAPLTATNGEQSCNIILSDNLGCTTEIPLRYTAVAPTITHVSGAEDQTVCEGVDLTDIVYTLGGVAISATASGLPDGVTMTVSGNTVTISGAPTTHNTYNFTITTVSQAGLRCTEQTVTGRIIVNEGNIVPTFNQAGPYCEGTTVSALPTTSTNNITGSWSPAITNRTNTYTFTPDFGQCATITTMTITVNPQPTLEYTSGSETLCNGGGSANIVFTYGGGANGAAVTNLPEGMEFNVNTSNHTIVISGTPTVTSGTYDYTVTTTGAVSPCQNISVTRTITINDPATITLTSGTSPQTVCAGTAITDMVFTYTGATGATATNLPAGLTQSQNTTAHTLTISGTPTAEGTFTVTTTGATTPCQNVSTTATVNISNPATLTPLTSRDAVLCIEVPWNDNIQYSFGGTATGATVTDLPDGITASVSGNVVTISGSPSVNVEAGEYTYTITTTGVEEPCENVSLTGTISISTNATLVLSSASGTDNQSICLPGTFTNIVYTYGGGATGIDESQLRAGLPAGLDFTVNTTAHTVTIYGTPTATGTFNYTVATTGIIPPCKPEEKYGTITISESVELDVAGNTTQSFCLGTSLSDIVFTYGGGATGLSVDGTLPAGVQSQLDNTAHTLTLSGTPTETGTFDFSVTTTGATAPCSNDDIAVSITIYDTPDVAINASDDAICNGSSVSLSANPASFSQYRWTCTTESDATHTITAGMPASTTASSISVSPTVTPGSADVVYVLRVSDGNNCVATVSQTITVSQTPTADIVKTDNTKCVEPYNGTITVSNFAGGVAGSTYTVSVTGQANQTTTGGAVTFSNLEEGSYTVRITNETTSADCYTEQTITIGNTPTSPEVSISGSLSICSGTNTTLTAHPSNGLETYTYHWSDNSASDVLVTPNLTAQTSYSLTVTDANGCIVTTSVTVEIGDTPEIDVSANNSCLGGNVVLQAHVSNAGTGYTVTWAASPTTGAGLTTTTGERITVTPTADDTYTYTATLSANSCSDSGTFTDYYDNVSVTVYPLPTAGITNTTAGGTNVITCTQQQITVTATGGTSYAWSNSVNVADNTFATNGTYTVTVTDANGCTATEDFFVDIDNSIPDISISNNPNTNELTCDVDHIELTASTTTLGATLSWTEPTVTTTNPLTVTVPDVYVATVTAENGCTATASVEITSDSNTPTVSITTPSTTTLNCTTTSITLNATGTGTMTWSPSNVATLNNYPANGDYTVTARLDNGCTTEATIHLDKDVDLPDVSISPDNPTLTCAEQNITLTASGTGISYAWYQGPHEASYTVHEPATYTVTATAANGCTASTSMPVGIDNDIPDVQITPATGVITCANPTIELVATTTTLGATLSWDSQEVSSANTYTVVATAPNGCTASASSVITSDGNLPQVSIDAPRTVLMCNSLGEPNDEITLTGSANVSVTFEWNNEAGTRPGAGVTYSVTEPGVYYVSATSTENGCVATEQIEIQQDISTPNVEIGNNSNTTVLTCNGPSISVSLIDDTDADIYQWSGGENLTGTGNAFTEAAIYYVTATAPNGCTSVDQIEITSDFATPTVSITNNTGTTVLTCDVSAINVTAVGSDRVVYYSWSGGSYTNQAPNELTTIGTYVVTATADNGCTATADIEITETMGRPHVEINAPNTDITCSQSYLTLTATGDAVSYAWSGGLDPNQAVNIVESTGVYTVTATASNGCTAVTSVTITENLTPPTVSIRNESGFNQIDCNATSVHATATGTGVSYQWTGGHIGAEIDLTAAGTYYVTATGVNGCQNTAYVVITEDFTVPQASITPSYPALDCAHRTVDLTANIVGGGTYLWDNGDFSQSITISQSGIYTVTVQGINGCENEVSIEILDNFTPPDARIDNITGEDVLTCNLDSIHIIAQGGYSFAWSNAFWGGGPEQYITSPGYYSVVVTARNGCTASAQIYIDSNMEPPTLYDFDTPNGLELNCAESRVSVTAVGNAQSYMWSGGTNPASQTNTFVTAGEYYLTATGFNGCIETTSITITDNHATPQVTINNGLGDIYTLDCNNPRIPITLIVSGADGPYEYAWSSNYTGSDDHGDLTAGGQYIVTVTSANHCESTASITLQENFDAPVVNVVSAPGRELNCVVTSIDLTANGVVQSYLWSNNATTATTTVYAADTYVVTVTGANGCEGTASITITQAPEFVPQVTVGTVSCYGGSTTASVTAVGGNPPYFCEWSDGQTGMTAHNLVAGGYSVTISDNGGCSAVLPCAVVQPTELVPTINVRDINCGVSQGALTAAIIGGTMPYQSYVWSNGVTEMTNENLGVGTYGLTVIDANGCMASAEAQISMQGMLSVNASVTQPISCSGFNDGSVAAVCPNAAQPAVYSWSTGNVSPELYNLFAGVYMVTVTDAWGCTGQAGVNLVAPQEMDVQIYSEAPLCHGSRDGSIVVSAFGGMAPYEYFWSNSTNENEISGIGMGTYSVTISDAAGCSVARTITLDAPEAINVDITVSEIKCNGDKNGRIEVAAEGGVLPYRYMIEGLVEQSTVSVFNNLSAGYYMLHVIDNNNCDVAEPVLVSQPDAIEMNIVPEDPFCRNSRTGKIMVNVVGGVEPYLYNLNNSRSEVSYMQNIPAGEYAVSVVDGNQCKSAEITVILTDVDIDCLRIPNVFTPNGDGVNDTWEIVNIEMFPAAEVRIFNRWGQQLFSSKGYAEPWDGSYRGHFVPAGTYMYVIDLFNDEEPYKGAVTIVY